MNEITTSEIAQILGLKQHTVVVRLRAAGIKPVRMIGTSDVYSPNVVDQIRNARPLNDNMDVLTASEIGQILGLKQHTVFARLRTAGIKPVRMVGTVGVYSQDVVDQIRLNDNMDVLTASEIGQILGLDRYTVAARLRTAGIKPIRMIGATGVYSSDVVDQIRNVRNARPPNDNMDVFTISEIGQILGLKRDTVFARLRTAGIEPIRMVGTTGVYSPDVVDQIRGVRNGRPPKKPDSE
jgi:DNA-binding CsgD family transcriptional regulator